MPAIASRRSLHLRLEPTGNNQASGINWAHDHELEPTLERMRATDEVRAPSGS